jgi:hypothetical protein
VSDAATVEAPDRLPILKVLRLVWHVYRRRWKFLVPLSLVVLLPQALGDAAVGDASIDRVETFGDVLKLASIPLTLAINLGGEALYAGIVAAAVVEWLAGRELRDVPGAIRSIEFGRLIVLDIILSIGTVIGLVFLIIPGLVFYTYLAVSPALIELNGETVKKAMRQSVQLVRGNFWRVLGFTLLVLVLTDFVSTALESPFEDLELHLVWNLVIEAIVEPFQGLTTVFLALALLEIHDRDHRLSAFIERTRAGRDAADRD